MALFLLVSAAAWLAFTVVLAASPSVPSRGHAAAVVMALAAVPLAFWGRAMLRRSRAGRATLVVSPEELVVTSPCILSEPLHLGREDVLAVIVDEGERQRFAVVDDPDWVTEELERHVVGHLWTKSAGGALPLLGLRAAPPDCAILFAGSRTLPVKRRPAMGDPAPNRRPRAQRLEAGLLIHTGDAERLRAALADWPTGFVVDRGVVALAHRPVRPEPPSAPAQAPEPSSAAAIRPTPVEPRLPSQGQASRRILAGIVGVAVAVLITADIAATFIAAAVRGALPPFWGFVGASLAVTLVMMLWPRHRRAKQLGQRVSAETQPGLWRVLEEAAAGIDVDTPDEVRVTLWPTISLTQRLRWSPRPHTLLEIGIPVLALVDPHELRVALATTLGAQRGRAALLVNAAWRARHPLQRALTVRVPRLLIFTLPQRLLYRMLEPLSEYLLRSSDALVDAVTRHSRDRVSHVWPTGVIDDAEAKMQIAQSHWDPYWHEIVVPALAAHDTPELSMSFQRWTEHAPIDAASELLLDLPLLEERLLTR